MQSFHLFILLALLTLNTSCSISSSKIELLSNLPNSAQDSLSVVSEGFSGLIITRGTYVDEKYNDIVNAITLGQFCTKISINRNSKNLTQHGVIHSYKNDLLKITATQSIYPECENYRIQHYLLIISSKPYSNNSIFIEQVESDLTLDLSFDEDEDYLITPLSTSSYANFIQSFSSNSYSSDPNLNAKHKILLNQLKAMAVSNSGDKTKNQVTWIKQINDKEIFKDSANGLELVQAKLEADSGVLILNWEDDKLAVTLITKDKFQHKVTKYSRTQIKQYSQNVIPYLHIQNQIANRAPIPNRGISLVQNDIDASNESTGKIEDVWSLLGEAFLPSDFKSDLKNISELRIIPAGELSSLPYAALMNPHTNHSWIDDFSLSIVPDLVGIIDKNYSWDHSENHKAIIIGNPERTENKGDYFFPNLPGAELEAKTVSEIWPSKLFTKDEASIQSIENNLAGISLLHIAAHGISDTIMPLRNSFLALSPNEHTNGNLSGLRVLNTNYSGIELAVMSACQSGLGYQHEQGTIGLARAFYISGVPRVVMSLWNVDDSATLFLMEHFHKALLKMSPSKALQYATIKAREKYKTADKWAPFLLFGAPN